MRYLFMLILLGLNIPFWPSTPNVLAIGFISGVIFAMATVDLRDD